MIYVHTDSLNINYHFAAEYYFSTEKNLHDDVFLIWNVSPTLVIGRFQNALEEVDVNYAHEHNIRIARRLSGGGTIYTDPGSYQYTILTKTPSAGGGIDFERFVEPIVDVFREMGLNAERSGRNDITVDGRKVSGNSQFRLGETTIHHGTLLFDTDIDELVRSTTPKDYKIVSKAIKSVRERVVNIRECLRDDMTPVQFRDHLVEKLTDSEYKINEEDHRRILEIMEERFGDENRIFSEVPKFELTKTAHPDGGEITIGLTVRRGKIEDCGISGDFFGGEGVEHMGGALRGVDYTREAVLRALHEFEGRLFRITTNEICDIIFS